MEKVKCIINGRLRLINSEAFSIAERFYGAVRVKEPTRPLELTKPTKDLTIPADTRPIEAIIEAKETEVEEVATVIEEKPPKVMAKKAPAKRKRKTNA